MARVRKTIPLDEKIELMNNESNTLFIVIPAYNESENIESCVELWYPILIKYGKENSRLVIVNDGSTDATWTILKKIEKKYPLLIPLNKKNGGHGSAVLFGYRFAVEQGADWVFQTDSDGQTNPDEFKEFWNAREKYDVVIGIRNERGDGRIRKVIERIVCLILRIIFGVKIPDANAPFRLMKSSILKKYINKLPSDFNLPNIMFTTYFVYFSEKILFLPISFGPRNKGKNSINLQKIAKIGLKAIGEFRELRRKIDD